MKFASLCLLAYKRPYQLRDCIDSLLRTADAPYELIVNLDSDNSDNSTYLFDLYKKGRISKLILSNGSNRGVGRSFANCVGVAEGDFIFKIDTDLTFEPRWLSMALKALDDYYEIGALSLFDYRHYDPNDNRFNHYSEVKDCYLVDDFVTSIYGFRRKYLELNGWQEDDGFHKIIQGSGDEKNPIHLAITKEDFVKNSGFGINKSTYVSGTEEHPFKTPTHDLPLIFNSGLNN